MKRTMLMLVVFFLLHSLALAQRIHETNVYVETIVGSGFRGYVDGQGVSTMFNGANSLAVDSQTNLYVWDSGNHRIRKVDANLTVTTFIGDGTTTARDGHGTNSSLSDTWFMSMAVDASDRILLGEGVSLRRFTGAGDITTLRTGGGGYRDGPLTNAQFNGTLGLSIDTSGNVIVADLSSFRVRKIDASNIVSTVAGSGNSEFRDGQGIFSSFKGPRFCAVDTVGNIYVADELGYEGAVLRRISPAGVVTSVAGSPTSAGSDGDGWGTNALFATFEGLVVDHAGNAIVSTYYSVRRITPQGLVTTIATWLDNVPKARGLAIDRGGRIYVARDTYIDRITFGPVPTNNTISIAMYAGINVSGPIGSQHRIEYSHNVEQGWTPISLITLTTSPYLWIDVGSTNSARRFYRAVPLP